ncbi:SAM-dependent methyltransferase, partial [Escherichia coli]|nr:SAM-dependent methyltransferase [Escherichia coli]
VAQAAHWLDLPRFYEEVRRVARADAILALVTYGVLHVDGPMEPLVQHFY